MSRLLFENSKFALGFAGVTLVGAAIFAGASGSSELLSPSGSRGSEEAADTGTRTASSGPRKRANQPVIEDFAPDNELIDGALGFDPTPRESLEAAAPKEPGEDESGSGKPKVQPKDKQPKIRVNVKPDSIEDPEDDLDD